MDNSSGMLFFPDGVRLKDGTELKGIYLDREQKAIFPKTSILYNVIKL